MLQFPTVVLITVFILQTWNIFTQITNGSITDRRIGKQVPTGSVKDWAENPIAMPGHKSMSTFLFLLASST